MGGMVPIGVRTEPLVQRGQLQEGTRILLEADSLEALEVLGVMSEVSAALGV